MRPAAIYLLLALLVATAVCSKLATPYQAMLVWYAYQLEIKTFPNLKPQDRYIAPKCPGTNAGKTCYFDELFKYLQDDASSSPWKGATTIGKTLNPSLETIRQDLTALGFNQQMDSTKLLPNSFTRKVALGQQLNYLTDAINQCRSEAKSKSINIDSELANIRTAMTQTHIARVLDQAGKGIEVINDLLKRRNIKWEVEVKDMTVAGGPTYKVVDTKETLRLHPGLSQELVDTLNAYAKDPEYASHTHVINAAQRCVGRLRRAPDC
nr:hypothetical protein B0A51_05022 [Rachicladosporium sp. CCFEE 5018]